MSAYRVSDLIASTHSTFVLNNDRHTVVVGFLNNFNVGPLLMRLCSDGFRSGSGLSLHFENLRSKDLLPAIDVYLNPENTAKEKNYIGSMGLYGLSESSAEPGGHDGSGQNRIFDVGEVFTKVCDQPNWSDKKFDLALIPDKPLPPEATLNIGRIALYYYEF
jgi:tyrosinase